MSSMMSSDSCYGCGLLLVLAFDIDTIMHWAVTSWGTPTLRSHLGIWGGAMGLGDQHFH